MDGPKDNPEFSEENMNALTFKDLLVLKQFIQKGIRENLFLQNELMAIKILLVKLDNICKIVVENNK